MGALVHGKWEAGPVGANGADGEFVRPDAQFRNFIGEENFPPEAGRYHLFVSLACPWAHRTIIFRHLKKLEEIIALSIVKPKMLDNGWELDQDWPSPVSGARYLYEVYQRARDDYSGRVTVPVFWDKKNNTIVNNESADIIRMLNSAFGQYTDVRHDYYPLEHQDEIETINAFVYHNINNGVYKTGFAAKQAAYEKNYRALFNALDKIEEMLARQRYLAGDSITEADWRLFTTLIRFDTVYYSHFKANRQRIEDFPNLSNYLRDLYQQPGIADTVDFNHIKTHYYYSLDNINPTRIVPLGPDINYHRAHNRAQLS